MEGEGEMRYLRNRKIPA